MNTDMLWVTQYEMNDFDLWWAMSYGAMPESEAPVKRRNAAACRAWARKNGFKVGTRGVIAHKVWHAYYKTEGQPYMKTARQWARDNGIKVGSRGVVSRAVLDAYAAA